LGIDLIFRGDGREFTTGFSLVEWDTLSRLEALLPDAVATVVGGADTKFGSKETFPVVDLLAAIDRIDDFLASRPHLLPDTFMFKTEYLLWNGVRFPTDEDQDFVTGGMSGLQLPGDPVHWYTIRAGVDECYLTKVAIGPDGKGRFVERRDLRGETEIVTTTCGRIQIRKRGDHAGIREQLAQVRKFLASLAGTNVTRTVSG
jgi:hypothetical protein